MKNAITLLFFVILGSLKLLAQSDTLAREDGNNLSVSNNPSLAAAELSPEYVGGLHALKQFIDKELKYPRKSRKAKIQGTVFVGFVVEPDGSATDIHIVKGLNKEMNDEVLRVMKKMEKWKPGSRNGHPVKSKFVMPVKCELPKKGK